MEQSAHADQARLVAYHQYRVDQITDRYEAEVRAGQMPSLAAYVLQYPDVADDLLEFAFYFHTLTADLPEPDEEPSAQLSPATNVALARIRVQPTTTNTALDGLIQPGMAAGYLPSQLAEALEISLDVLAKLEERAIALASIPESFLQHLAQTLEVAYEAVVEHLGGEMPPRAYSGALPRQQESFLEAIWSSPLLPEERKQVWEERIKQS